VFLRGRECFGEDMSVCERTQVILRGQSVERT